MKIICAPDSFKESLDTLTAAHAMAMGVLSVLPDAEVDVCPIGDGGEGSIAALLAARGKQAQRHTLEVIGPLGKPVQASWAQLNNVVGGGHTAFIEMAQAAGLTLVPRDQRNPLHTTTYGVGQLIQAALQTSPTRVVVGLGGSSTCDGGAGALQAMGVQFYDAHNALITPAITGAKLAEIASIRIPTGFSANNIVIASDVGNPMVGNNGAAQVYGPQKGATAEQVIELDQALMHFATLIQRIYSIDVETMPGAGAAGGFAGGFAGVLRCPIRSGIDLILDMIDFDTRLNHADLCLTGEGRIDSQTLSGKAVYGVLQRANARDVPTLAFAGALGAGASALYEHGLLGAYEIGRGLPRNYSLRHAESLLSDAVAQAVEYWSHAR